MSFGRKGLAAGQAAPRPGGLGQAAPSRAGLGAVAAAPEPHVSAEEMMARREAFIASERARMERQGLAPSQPKPSEGVTGIDGTAHEDPLINLRNMRPTERPARRQEPASPNAGQNAGAPVGANGMTAAQEAEIRAAARGMARGEAPRRPGGGGGKSGKTFFFGDPSGRSLGMAYLIWFVIGQTSLHRVYCGQGESAIYQVGLLIGSILAAFIFLPFAFGIVIWMFWLLADLFLMPGMMRRFKAKYEYNTGVFD